MIELEEPVTPMSYLGELAAMACRHGRELTAAMVCALAVVAIILVTISPSLTRALFVVSVAATILLFEAAATAWRLHRRQRISLASTRSLLDLNAADRAELERHLRSRYRRREARIHERNAVRLEHALQTRESSRADDDGWPIQA